MRCWGDEIRRRRNALGLSQEEASELACVARSTWQLAEGGKSIAKSTAMRIARALDLPFGQMVLPEPEELAARLFRAGFAPPPLSAPAVPRSDERAAVERLLEDDGAVCIAGSSGIGKTQLAARVARDVAERYPGGVVWLRHPWAEGDAAPMGTLVDAARAMGIEARLPPASRVGPAAFWQAFLAELASRPRLLILDDVRSLELVGSVATPAAPALLCTTGTRAVAERFPQVVELGPLPVGDCRVLLEEHIGSERVEADPAGVEGLVAWSGGLPRIVQMLGHTLAVERYLAPADLLRVLDRPNGHVGSGSQALLEADAGVRPMGRLLRERLSSAGWRALEALSVFGDRPFDLAWARAAVGTSALRIRRELSELVNLYLAQEVPPGARWTLDSQAAALGRAFSVDEADAAMGRLCAFAARQAKHLAEQDAAEVVRAVGDDVALWRMVLNHLTARVLPQPPVGLPSPEDLPAAREMLPPEASELPEIVLGLAAFFLGQPPVELAAWGTAAMAVARRDRPELVPRLMGLMARWAPLHGYLERSLPWCEAAGKELFDEGRTEEGLELLAHGTKLAFLARGPARARPAFARLAARARRVPVAPASRAHVLVANGVVAAMCGDFHEAEGLFLEVLQRDPEAIPITAEAATLNLAVVRVVSGVECDREAARGALRGIRATTRGVDLLDDLTLTSIAGFLGLTDRKEADAEAFGWVPPGAEPRRVAVLTALCRGLAHHEANAGSSDRDLWVYPWMYHRPGQQEVGNPGLLVPLGPVRRGLLDGGARAAHRYLAEALPPSHPLVARLAAVASKADAA